MADLMRLHVTIGLLLLLLLLLLFRNSSTLGELQWWRCSTPSHLFRHHRRGGSHGNVHAGRRCNLRVISRTDLDAISSCGSGLDAQVQGIVLVGCWRGLHGMTQVALAGDTQSVGWCSCLWGLPGCVHNTLVTVRGGRAGREPVLSQGVGIVPRYRDRDGTISLDTVAPMECFVGRTNGRLGWWLRSGS